MSFHKFILPLMILASVVGFVGCGGETTSTLVPETPVPQVETPKKPLPVITGNPNAIVGEDGETRLYVAAQNGNTPLVEALIIAGADVNQGDKHGWTALQGASQSGHVEAIKVLLANGANVNQANKLGVAPLLLASMMGKVEAVKVLIANGANVNQAAVDGDTPLHLAIKSVQIGMDRAAVDGDTPLHLASGLQHIEVVKVLLANGADKTLKDHKGETPLDAAKNDSVKALLRF